MIIALGYSLAPIPELLFNDSLIKLLAKSSIHIIKMYGESGSPCLIPLDGLINPVGLSLINKEYETEAMHSIIHLIHISWKPNTFRQLWIKSHSNLS